MVHRFKIADVVQVIATADWLKNWAHPNHFKLFSGLLVIKRLSHDGYWFDYPASLSVGQFEISDQSLELVPSSPAIPTPETEAVCTCEIKALMNFGCRCV